jgi:C1A family cysteine protease
MLHSAHIFIGEELSTLHQKIAQVIEQQPDAATYNHLYLLTKESKDQFAFNGSETIASSQMAQYWSEDIFDQILNIDANQHDLKVFIHFSLYRSDSFDILRALCTSIQQAQRPTTINFVAYSQDLDKFIEGSSTASAKSKTELLSAKQSLDKLKSIYNDYQLVAHRNNLILLQNRTPNGLAILKEEDGSQPFYDMIGYLLPLISAHYDDIFSHTIGAESHDLLGLGLSTLYFDKYLFVDYLLQRVFLQTIDNQSVNIQTVDVNIATDKAEEILRNKTNILSNFRQKYSQFTQDPNYNEIAQEVDEILQRLTDYIEKENSMPTKAAVLAAILSQTDCELFDSSFQYSSNDCYEDLYAETINFFIENDQVDYYKIYGEKPINSIEELKKINRTLVQTSTQIRRLEKELETYSTQIDRADSVEECLIDDGYFKFKDKKFRLLPNFDEEPLQESYVPHDVNTKSIDLRSNFSPIKDQGQQGSCLSFALTSIFEYIMKVNHKEDCDLSEAFLYYNARNLDENETTNEDNGSRFHPSIAALSKYGLALEKLWPYSEDTYSTRPSEQAYEDAATRKLVKALNVDHTVYAIKSALADGYPVAASFVLYPSFFSNNGYVSIPTAEEREDNTEKTEEQKRHNRHAMVIVGYSDELQMFIVRNSWGRGWGDKGYCYIPYEYIEDPTLFEFACILSEVASLKQPKMNTIPALKMDTTDIQIRYYIALADLKKQQQTADNLREQRRNLQTYLENQKSVYSDANERDAFIDANIDNLKKKNDELKNANAKHEEKINELNDFIKRTRLVALVDCGVSVLLSAVILLSAMIGGYHWKLWATIAGLIALPYMIYMGYILRKDTVTAAIKIVSAAIVTMVFLPLVIFAEHKFTLWWISTLLVTIPYIIYTLWTYWNTYKEWRDERDDHLYSIQQNEAEISKNLARINSFRSHAFAAWKTIDSLKVCQSKLVKMYTNFINLLNNLRTWYEEINNSNNSIEIKSRFPNITIQDKDLMDQYFQNNICETDICEVNLSQDINKHEIAADYLTNYKVNLKKNLQQQLTEHLEKINFNISDHAVANTYKELALPITNETFAEWMRKANTFLQINSTTSGVLPTRHYIFAYKMNEVQNQLSNKVNRIYPTMVTSQDKYKMTLLSVTPLNFEECVLFQ